MSAPAPVRERALPRGLPMPLALVCVALIAVGVLSFAAGLLSDHPETAWRAFHVNFLYFAGLSQAGLVLACAFVIIGAGWPGPVRRIAEALAAWVPVTFVLALFVLLLGGAHHIFPWIEHPIEIKAPWLNPARFWATQLGVLFVLAVLTLAFLRASVRPTLGGVAERAPVARGLYERWTAGWRGDEAEREASERRLRVLAPIICLVFAVGYSLVGFDQVMSVAPMWFSNLFGAYFAWGGFLSAVAATALVAVLLRHSPGLEGHIDRSRMHDLGKMLFAFSIFWMYLFWSQYIVIWYGNLPEETSFVAARLGPQFLQDKGMPGTRWLVEGFDFSWERLHRAPYAWLSMAVWACCWIVPFWVLLGQRPKRSPLVLGGVALVMLVGFWLERNVLIWPSLVPDDGWAWFGPVQIGIALGFLGAFALVFLIYTRVFPALAVPSRD